MKSKKTYVLLVIMLAVFVIFLKTRPKIGQLVPENVPQETAETSSVSPQQFVSDIGIRPRPAITIVKPATPRNERSVKRVAASEDAIPAPEGETAAAAEDFKISKAKAADTPASAPEAVKPGRLPSELESREMNVRGIVMY